MSKTKKKNMHKFVCNSSCTHCFYAFILLEFREKNFTLLLHVLLCVYQHHLNNSQHETISKCNRSLINYISLKSRKMSHHRSQYYLRLMQFFSSAILLLLDNRNPIRCLNTSLAAQFYSFAHLYRTETVFQTGKEK